MKKRLALLLTLLALTFSPLGVNSSRADQPAPADEMSSPLTLTDLPLAAQPAVSAALGRGDTAYQFIPSADGYHVKNAARDLIADFSAAGMKLSSVDAEWTMALQSIGWGDALEAVAEAEPEATANRLEYVRGDLTEWYINGPYGLEQGFTLASRPTGSGGVLTLSFAMGGNVQPRLSGDGTALELVNDDGTTAFRYAGLSAHDTSGKALRAWLETSTDGSFKIRVDDTGAQYPLTIDPWVQQAYLKASNTGVSDYFGRSVALSGDTLVVGAYGESSNATGVNGDQSNNSAVFSGAAYVFTRSGGVWSQQAYLKASNTGGNDYFGSSVAVSGDTLVVGAYFEASNATGVNGNQSNNSAFASGAAYVFTRSGGVWSQQAYLKASNTEAYDYFGNSVALSGDTLVVGAYNEDSNSTGVNGNQSNNSANSSGAAYVFTRSGSTWSQQTYLKASNTGGDDQFGYSVALSGDTLVVGAATESSNATGVNGNQSDNSAGYSGAAYVFTRSGSTWSQQSYLKASNTETLDLFGFSVALLGDTLVVGAYNEDSNSTGVNGNQSDNSAFNSGAAYVFMRSGSTWSQQAYLKASNTGMGDYFGSSVTLSGDTLVVGAEWESSNATGVNGNQSDNSAAISGAAYAFYVDNTFPIVASQTLQASYTGTGPSSFTVTFSEAVNNAGGGVGVDDAANPNNYVVMEQGAVSGFQTTACNSIDAVQDTRVTPSGVTYIPNTAIVNLGSALPAGTYRLFVCGTTSIVDLAGNPLNGGVDYPFDFVVSASASGGGSSGNGTDGSGARWLPKTGFAPNVVTRLPEQPAELAYTQMSDLWLEIPSQKVKANIVGVPQSEKIWDVKWLGNDAGWLNGTAFPSWEGNSVLTGHVMGADGLPGPFAKLQDLKYGERIIVHMLDQQYVFEVRNKRLVRPDSTAFAFEHLEDASYLTLITCSGYSEEKNAYSFRRLVRAVLVEVK